MDRPILANSAISLFGHLFFMVPLVWIVIAIETFILRRKIKSSFIKAFGAVTLANLLSTFVGIPITWFLTNILCLPIVGIAYLLKPEYPEICRKVERVLSLMWGGADFMTPGHVALFASIFLLIPYYYATVFIEYHIMKPCYTEIEAAQIKRTVVLMNRITYFLLGGLILVIFLLGEYFYKWEY